MPYIRNKRTGETVFVPDEPQAAPTGIPVGPQDPTMGYKAPQAAADLQRTQAGIANDGARLDIARQQLNLQRDQANKPPAGYRFKADGTLEPIPGGPADPRTLQAATKPALTAKERADAIAGYQSGSQLDRIVNQLEEQYKVGPGSTSWARGFLDYLPLTENQQFDRTGNAARGIVGSALGFTGGQLNTATEAEAAVGPYLPQSSDRDATILDKIARLKALAGDARNRSAAILGGVPDQNGVVTPQLPAGARNAMEQTFLTQGPGPAAAGAGATIGGQAIPQAYQDEHAKFIAQNLGSPTFADDYVAFRVAKDQENGFGSNPEDYRNYATAISRQPAGSTLNTAIPPVPKQLSGVEQFRNNLVSNPTGAMVAGAADAGGFGIPSMLAGDQMSAIGDQNPLAMVVGQVGGSIFGAGALGKAGKMGIDGLSRGLPRLAQTASKASPFARSLATDAAYSGIYGANTGQDPLMSAGLGAVGSTAGQGVGKALGTALAGPRLSRAVQALRSRGIPMTTGQQIGGFAKSAEDAMTSLPGIGDLVNARRLEGLQALNREAFSEAGQPVGARVSQIGEEGVAGLMDQIGNSYDQATAGVRVPLDPQFNADLGNVAQASRMLPPDYAGRFATAMDNRVGPIAQAGEMTGDAYQQAVRGLKGYRASAGQAAPGFEGDYRDALSLAQDALTGQMQRGGGAGVVDGLSRADQAYRMTKVLQDAVRSAKGGSGSGEVQTFTGSQLQNAGYKAQSKFPGKRPFAALADNAQRVLPSKVPDSGTAKRMLTAALPTAIGGSAAGGGIGYMAGDTSQGAGTGAALAVLLAAGGTKAGQKALQKLLIDRPAVLKKVGRSIGKRKGLFGTASLPLLIEGNN